MVYSLVSEFSKWLAHAGDNGPCKTKPFRLTWKGEGTTPQPGVGLELSKTGVVFAAATRPPTKEVTLVTTIRERPVTFRVAILREAPFNMSGKPGLRFTSRLVGIGADDWDLLLRELNDQPEPENRAADQLAAARKKDDDAYRTLPLRAQRKIIDILVGSKRLEQPAEGVLPALRMNTVGRVQSPDGRVLRRINIHSRRHVPEMDATMSYDTQITVDDAGNVALLS